MTARIDARIRRLFPFPFTAGQNRAIAEISADVDKGQAMHRLLQADVGAGKTAVALYAMLLAVASGYQAVLMAPTDVLARQHALVLETLLARSRVRRLALSGGLSAAQRRAALESIASGAAQIVVGTQAVVEHDVVFEKLGLAVIDEQHKFGVRQRGGFQTRGPAPHVLVMTATPIPRSLCLTQFGDLDLSLMTDKPPGRQPVVTSLVSTPPLRAKAWEFVRRKLSHGRQLYVVCPRIDDGHDADSSTAAATRVAQSLAAGELAGISLELLHGRLAQQDKNQIFDNFRAGSVRALVATSLVEVGVDVPNATLMVVLDAEHFGLAQLHQLRGRVGRGAFNGYCFLFSDSQQPQALDRLETLVRHESGFDVAEADFRLRGPGDILGTRQHGELPLLVADLVRDSGEIEFARQAAFDLVASGTFDTPEFAPLKIRVLERFGRLFEISGAG